MPVPHQPLAEGLEGPVRDHLPVALGVVAGRLLVALDVEAPVPDLGRERQEPDEPGRA